MFVMSATSTLIARLIHAIRSTGTKVCITSAVVLVAIPSAPAQRVAESLIVFYEFNEGSGTTVGDTSGFGDPLDLTIDDASAISWGPGILTVEFPTIATNPDPATKVIDAVSLTDEITVEAWVQPENNTLSGAARIVGVSNPDPAQAPFTRNFMLGQDNGNVDFRFRTTATGDNGASPQMQTDSTGAAVLNPPELMHIVATRAADGTSLIYVDGEIRSDINQTQGGDTSNWDLDYRFTLAHEFADPTADSRSWLGDFHLVAVYNRALSEVEIGQNFDAGPNAGSETLLLGDFNSDGTVDLVDFNILTANFKADGPTFAEGDINFDRQVDLTDFVEFRAIFAASNATAASVPEPASIQMGILGLSLLLVRRRNA